MSKYLILLYSTIYVRICTVELNFSAYDPEKTGIREALCIKTGPQSPRIRLKCCAKSAQIKHLSGQKSGLQVIQEPKSEWRWLPHTVIGLLDETICLRLRELPLDGVHAEPGSLGKFQFRESGWQPERIQHVLESDVVIVQ